MKETKIIYLLILLLLFTFSSRSMAQEMQIKSLTAAPLDQTANQEENLHQDLNGDYGGLVKVMIAAPVAQFEGLVLEHRKVSPSEHWVFMAKGSKNLKVTVSGYLPLQVSFSDYGIVVEPKKTYILTITLPLAATAVPVDDGMRYLAMTVEPKNSIVYVDENLQQVTDGYVSVLLPQGSHSYRVDATGYISESGTVTIGDSKQELTVSLKSAMATLSVECPTSGAVVYVNGQRRGTAPWSGSLLAGNYKIEARLDGYRTQTQSVTLLQSESKSVSLPALEMITGRLNVNYTPVRADVYIDGKKVATTPGVFRHVMVGSRRVEIRKDGYEPLTKTVTIEENKQTDLTGSLTAVQSSAVSAGNVSSAGTASSTSETVTVNGVCFNMIRVDGGTFTMGATSEQGSDADGDEKPAHQVTLSSFSIGQTEVTQALWKAVMGSNPSHFKGDDLPVECVSWDDCQLFIQKLNRLTGKSFRLPTEAEWEFAARGGNKSKHYKYSGSNNIGLVAWYNDNSGSKTHPVGQKQANELGLYDMSGNVWDWCNDWYGEYSSSSQTNPRGAASSSYRVYRGGSWYDDARDCRVSYRISHLPGIRCDDLGLRLAL